MCGVSAVSGEDDSTPTFFFVDFLSGVVEDKPGDNRLLCPLGEVLLCLVRLVLLLGAVLALFLELLVS